MNRTSISWTEFTWNPVTGCTGAGTPECDHCYAEALTPWLQGMGNPRYNNGFNVTLHPEALGEPLATNPNMKRYCMLPSMGELFHHQVTEAFIDDVFSVVERTPWITYQVITKWSYRLNDYFTKNRCPANVWLGVTCGCKQSLFRVEHLRGLAAPVRWLSIEPCLDDLANEGLDFSGIDWSVVGGESGPKARPMLEAWALNLKDLADANGTAFFFKQWGTWGEDNVRRSKEANGHLLGGVEYHNYPTPRLIY